MRFLNIKAIRSITGKVIICMLLMELSIFTLLGIFIYSSAQKVIQSETIKSETQLMNMVSKGIEDNIYSCIDETVVFLEEPAIIEIVNSKASSIGESEKKQLEEYISQKMNFDKNIQSVLVSNGIYSYTYPTTNGDIGSDQIKGYVTGKSKLNSLDTGDYGVVLCKLTGKNDIDQQFAVFKRQGSGFVAILLKNDFLKDNQIKYNYFIIGKDSNYVKYDVSPKELKQKSQELSSSQLSDISNKKNESWSKIDNNNTYIYNKHFYSFNTNFFCTVSKKDIEGQIGSIKGFIVITFGLGTICFFILSLLILHGLNRPLLELRYFIDNVDIHDKNIELFNPKKSGFFRRLISGINLKNKMYIVLVFCTIVPILIVTLFTYSRSSAIIADRINSNSLSSIEISSAKVGGIIDSYNRLTKNIMGNMTVERLLISGPSKPDPNKQINGGGPENDLSYIILREQVSNLKFVNVVLFNNDKKMIYSLIPQKMAEGSEELLKRYKIDESHGNPVWTDVTYDRAWDYKFSLLSEIYCAYPGIEYGRKIGYIITTFSIQDIERVFEDILRENQGNVFIIDGKGKYVLNTDRSKINNISDVRLIKDIGENRDSFYFENGKSSMVTYVSKVPGISWKVVAEVPRDNIYSKTWVFFIATLYILLLFIIIILFISRKIANHFIGSIIDLKTVMSNIEAGDLSSRYHGSTGDEIESLGKSFNIMLERIQELVIELAAAGIKEKELESKRNLAELKALHAQINPHFLYNTLESINSLALIKGMEDISKMAVSLGNMFRFSVKSGNKFVSFREEINHVENYLKIQKIRYSDLFVYKIDIDPLIYDCYCVKLILQPIVENALYHGVEKKGENGLILIKGEIVGDKIKLSVCDNGSGVSSEKLKEINDILMDATDNNSGIGLFNVNRRIRLHYGNEYGLKIFSVEGEETRVEILLPCVHENN